MAPRPTTAPRTLVLTATVLALTSALLTGCSGAVDAADDAGSGDAGAGPAASQTDATTSPDEAIPTPDATSSASADGFPSCDEVKAALGPVVAGLVEIADTENGVANGSDGPALGCGWYTTATADGSTDLASYGAISLGVSHDPTYTEESMQPLGWNVDDPRVTAAGAWALKVGGGYDPAAQLDATGVQVVRGDVVVVLTSGGVVLQDVPELASLTNEWALGAGVAVLDLMR
ncbi:hypothetical protein [Herbiconiux liangxiaofengii]|uniref:hypothetical protein n=1 Tax=Herbiconiux liangxiaofengii TaxID=3342795 RepID=UPI0035BA5A39